MKQVMVGSLSNRRAPFAQQGRMRAEETEGRNLMENASSEGHAIDLAQFSIDDFDVLVVDVPQRPEVVEEDIDAQLFEYVASGWRGDGKRMNKLSDIDDEWVKGKFPNIGTVEELRRTIREDLEKRADEAVQEFKIRECSKELVSRLHGEVPDEIVDENVEPVRKEYLQQLVASGSSLAKYLQQENMTNEQFEERLREDVAYRIKLNVALDLLAQQRGTQVEDHELTDYLMAEDPDAFLAEVKDRGMLEDARTAAARIKVMREVVDSVRLA